MTQQTQQIQQTQQGGGDYTERLVRVEKDVVGLKEGLTSLTGSVERGFAALTGDLKARQAFNWQPISILVVALIAVAGWGWALFGSYQARTDAAIAEQKLISTRFVDREDIKDKFQVAKEKRDDVQRMTDARIERIERDVDGQGKSIVPRGEHEQTWAGQRQRDAGLQRQIDELRKGLGDLNTPRDTIQDMRRQIEDLQRQRWEPPRR